MPNLNDFIRRYSNITIGEKPFCDADNVAFCKISYMPIEKVVSDSFDDEPIPFAEAAKKIFALNGNKHRALGLFLMKDISETIMQMAETKRYSEFKVVACKAVFEENPAVQFGAATFIAPNGDLIVTFRGTDDTLAGWKEDIDLVVKKGVPSHELAVNYLNELGEKFDGNIIILGHSKGANVALFAALNCNQSVRDRIVRLYNNDGPGYHNYDYLDSKEYKELLPKYSHFIPSASFFGMFYTHDEDYTVIKSKKLSGLTQHDVNTWAIDCDGLVETDFTWLGKFNDRVMMKLLTLSEEQYTHVGMFFDAIVDGLTPKTMTGVLKNAVSSVSEVRKLWKGLDEKTKKITIDFFKGWAEFAMQSVKYINNETVPNVKSKIEMLETLVR